MFDLNSTDSILICALFLHSAESENMPGNMTVIDPLGKLIYLLPEIFFTQDEIEEIYDDAATVIKKPAVIIEGKENGSTQYYYFRSVGWNRALLIVVHWNNSQWEAYKCIENPSTEMLVILMKEGTQIF